MMKKKIITKFIDSFSCEDFYDSCNDIHHVISRLQLVEQENKEAYNIFVSSSDIRIWLECNETDEEYAMRISMTPTEILRQKITNLKTKQAKLEQELFDIDFDLIY